MVVWVILRVMVYLSATPRVQQLVSESIIDCRIMRCDTISLCQSAATSEIGHESDSRKQLSCVCPGLYFST